MHVTTTNGVELEYETFGNPADPTLLLVMGFGTQLIGWDAELCRQLADRGRQVIRYDNRDCGLSTKWDAQPGKLMDFIGAVTSGDVDGAIAMAPIRCATWPSTGSACWTLSTSSARTWSVPRWA